MQRLLENSRIDFFAPPSDKKAIINYGIIGGAEWPGAAVDPRQGLLFVASSNYPEYLKLVNMRDFEDNLEDHSPGGKFYAEKCLRCHGLSASTTEMAFTLYKMKGKYSYSQALNHLLRGGRGMPSFRKEKMENLKAVLDFIYSDKALKRKDFKVGDDRKVENHYVIDLVKELSYENEGGLATKMPWGNLTCLNLNTGKIAWKIPLGEVEDPETQEPNNWGAPVATAGGLVFVGGTTDRFFRAFDQQTGKLLWSYRLPGFASAPAAVYELNQKEYILVPATGRFQDVTDTFIAFTLPNNVHLQNLESP
jgi:quinoprotein glucose dehydrogenase